MITASIDIGSNSVLLLVAEVNRGTKEITVIKDLLRLPGISRGLLPGKKISLEAVERLFSVLSEYFIIIRNYKCDSVLLSGTSALRIASNADDIKERIKNECNADLKILTGKEEAELAFKGTQSYEYRNELRLVIDIGGGSTELIYGHSKILYNRSFNIGVVSLTEKYLMKNIPSNFKLLEMNEYLNKVFGMLRIPLRAPYNGIALAGTPVTLACIKNGLSSYNEYDVEGTVLNYQDIQNLYYKLSNLTPENILMLYHQVVKGREDLILNGCYILLYIMKLLMLDKVIVSTKGVRYGAIYKYLDSLIGDDSE